MSVIAAYPFVARHKPMPAAAVRQDAIVSADAHEAPARDDTQACHLAGLVASDA
jgi:hypothetical protein